MTTATLSRQAHADVLAALSVSNLPDVHWLQGDDLCDCTFQRIGSWTNPYLGKTLRVRLCCIWSELYRQYPQHVQQVDAYYDENRHAWVDEPREWDSTDDDMPPALWYRQIAARTGASLSAVRAEYASRREERPKKIAVQADNAPAPQEIEAARIARLRLTGWL